MDKIGRVSFEFGLWITTFFVSQCILVLLLLVAVFFQYVLGDNEVAEIAGSVAVLLLGAIFVVGHMRTTYFVFKNSEDMFLAKYPKFKETYFWSWIGGITRIKLEWTFFKYTFNFKRADKDDLLSI